MFFTLIGWVLFNLTDFSAMLHALKTMFVYTSTDWAVVLGSDISIFSALFFLPVSILFCFPIAHKCKIKDDTIVKASFINVAYVALLAFCILYIISSSFNPFIYFRF